jgi:hypothetical protein
MSPREGRLDAAVDWRPAWSPNNPSQVRRKTTAPMTAPKISMPTISRWCIMPSS